MMRLQYQRIKAESPSAIVAFEVGDFIHVAGERDVAVCRQLLNLPMPDFNKSDPFVKVFRMDDARWPVTEHASNAEKIAKAGLKIILIHATSPPASLRI